MDSNKASLGTIAFFSGFSLPHIGGVETYTRRLAAELVRRGYRVLVVSFNYNNGPWRQTIDGIEEFHLPTMPITRERYPFPKLGRRYFRMMAQLRREGIDHIIVNTRFHITSLIGARLGVRIGVPVSLVEHGSAPLTLDSRILDMGLGLVERVLFQVIRKHVNSYYGVSEAAALHLQHRFGIQPSGVWFNSINITREASSAARVDATDTRLVTIMYAGRIIRQKGVDSLLEAYQSARDSWDARGIASECVIAGDGAYLDELKQRFQHVKGVNFLGRVTQDEVQDMLKRTDVFVYAPNHPEGLPSSLLEAGIASCAVIGSPYGGIKEIIRNGDTGLMVDSTVSAIAKALTSLVMAPDLRQRLGESLHDEVVRRFSTVSVVDQMLSDLGLTDPTPTSSVAATPKSIRVLHLLISNRVSGAENVVLTIMDLFRDSEYCMVYCSPDGPIRHTIEQRGLAYQRLSRLSPGAVRIAVKRAGVDVIHAHDFIASVLAACSGFPGRIVSHIHSNPGFVKSWNPLTAVFKAACHKFARIVFVSDEAVKGTVFAPAVADKVRVIRNVVDQERVRHLSTEQDVRPSDVVFVGRLIDLKHPRLVIETVAKARALGAGITARLVGDGHLRGECERDIETYGLRGAVTLEGFQSNPYPYIHAARVALMPSSFEGLGLVAIECLALGVPVLNSGAGGLGDIFRGHPEFICETADDYVAKIGELTDPDVYQQYQQSCAEMVAPYVDLDQYRSRISELYTNPTCRVEMGVATE